MKSNHTVPRIWCNLMPGKVHLIVRICLLQFVCILFLGTCALNSLAAPDAALRVSKSTVESLIPLMFPEELKLAVPKDSVLKIRSFSLNLQHSPASISISGDVTKNGSKNSIPVSAEIALNIIVENGALLLTPELLIAGPRYADIPLSNPITLVKAWFLSAISVFPTSITSITIPLQSQLEIPSVQKTIRSRESFGDARADMVAHIRTNSYNVALTVEAVDVVNNSILVTFSTDSPDKNSAIDFVEVGTTKPDSNGFYIGGNLLSRVLNRIAGNVSIPFYLENPQGKIAGDRSSTMFGTKEWYVEFQGNRPLTGNLQMQTSYRWNQQLSFSSQVSISAQGRIHGHGDPGPGGGCGVRPRALIRGATQLNGGVNVATGGGKVRFSIDAIDPSPARLDYDVERVNFCGFTSRGPFRGAFNVDVPRNLATTDMVLQPLIGKITDNTIIKSTITESEKIAAGYWILFEAEVIPYE